MWVLCRHRLPFPFHLWNVVQFYYVSVHTVGVLKNNIYGDVDRVSLESRKVCSMDDLECDRCYIRSERSKMEIFRRVETGEGVEGSLVTEIELRTLSKK